MGKVLGFVRSDKRTASVIPVPDGVDLAIECPITSELLWICCFQKRRKRPKSIRYSRRHRRGDRRLLMAAATRKRSYGAPAIGPYCFEMMAEDCGV